VLGEIRALGVNQATSERAAMWRVYSALINRPRRYAEHLKISEYEARQPTEPIIFFNPGCWAEKNLTARQVNHLRAHVIRALRREFGDRFVGGFVPSPAAQEHYPDLQYERVLSHAEYIQMAATARVAIYTNGTNGCISWKLGEYLAAGVPIVGETLNSGLPVPLEGAFFGFNTVEECVSHCARLMEDDAAAGAARSAAGAYYAAHTQPKTRMWQVIQQSSSLTSRKDAILEA
jgi:hypothetical protein